MVYFKWIRRKTGGRVFQKEVFATTRKECNEPEEFWWLAEVLQTVFLPISINVWMYNIDNEKLKFCKCIYNANAIDYW